MLTSLHSFSKHKAVSQLSVDRRTAYLFSTSVLVAWLISRHDQPVAPVLKIARLFCGSLKRLPRPICKRFRNPERRKL
jgi:hypothetical protein